jgi:hypothetical protein
MIRHLIVFYQSHSTESVSFEANVNPPFQGGFLLASANSKVCFECPQNCFKTLETPCPAPLKVGGESYSEVVRF